MKQREIPETIWDAFFQGDRLACARLITRVDNHPELVPQIMHRLFPHLRKATRIGITGPPGVGKSTITASLAREALASGLKVGVIAVDPSSPFSGGAFLGDRIRMQELIGNPDVFIRSLASRSGGGLSASTPYVADVFDAFGMDIVLIETVGVGQAELDILTCSDVIMLVLQPSTGDVIQMLKAGIMETADLFVINKADLPGADQLSDYIHFIFQTSSHYSPEDTPPVLKASALKDFGVDLVFNALMERIKKMTISGAIDRKREERMVFEIEKATKNYIWERYLQISPFRDVVNGVVSDLIQRNQSPYPFIQHVCSSVRIELEPGSDS